MRKILVAVMVCSVASIAGANLLTNGGFESGASGWTQWSSWWGSGESWNYSYTPAYEGNAALSLTAQMGSFGVLQVFDVQPGLPVDISFALKAQDFGDNVYEVLLYDGAVDGVYIDTSTQPEDVMFHWDSAGGGDGFPQPNWTTGSNSRTPTGNQMTVAVRATGGDPFGPPVSVDGQFDSIEVTQIPEPLSVVLGIGGLVAFLRRRRR